MVHDCATSPVWLATTQPLKVLFRSKLFVDVPAILIMAGLPLSACTRVTVAAKLGVLWAGTAETVSEVLKTLKPGQVSLL